MRILALLALITAVSGCVAPPAMMRDHNKIIAQDGGLLFNTHSEVIERPYAEVKADLERTAPRCLTKTAREQTSQIYGNSESFVRFHPGDTENSFILAYLFKLDGAPDEEAGNILVAEVSSKTPATTYIKTHHYHPPLAGTYEVFSDIVVEWARGEHDMCLSY
ncbi:hypothetical protein [Marinobacter sp. DUT-1]|uniref:hypothetical protein n=1 Tax=Marinobacter sp. DUT-1 TaxID=3412037 RepID=UPI003D174F49